jgi:hydrogenase/urease accessory protein HupE
MATRWCFVLAALLPGVFAAAPAAAHEMRPATLALRDLGGGAVQFEWNPPLGRPGDARRVVPEFPSGCVPVSPNRLQCAAGELAGELHIAGLRGRPVQVFVQLQTKDGERRTAVLDARRDRMQLGADAAQEMDGVAFVYFVIGVEHILAGFDHLLFVVGLTLLVGFTRRLVATVTGFTLAHSLTLALSVLDLVRVPVAAVEALIALSIVLTAAEVLDRRPTVVRRFPWLVAFAFGLLHGLGFASALREIGLPSGQLFTALLSFNLGVEAGQLAVIAVCFAAARGLRRWLPARSLRRGAAWGIGSLAAYWFVERVVGIVG